MKVTVLGSGSKGNSTLIQLEEINILIDVGFSYNKMQEKLSMISIQPKQINLILITHDHSDHIKGLETFLKNNNTLVYVSEKISQKNVFLKKYTNKKDLKDIEKKEYSIKIIPASHDATDTKGFVIEEIESLVYLTDTGYVNKRYFEYLKNREYYIFESNHDEEMLRKGKYPEYLQRRILSPVGHLSNRSSAIYLSMLIGNKTKQIVLAHLSEENNTPKKAIDTFNEVMKKNNISFQNVVCAKQESLVKVND